MNIPSYPSFRPLDIADKPLFDAVFRAYPPEISEYTFTNLYSWEPAYHFEASRLDGLIILSALDNGVRKFLDPIGQGDKKSAILKAMKDFNAVFARVPEATAGLFNRQPGFVLKADTDNADYLFLVEDLVKLQGRRYDGKRNFIKRFKVHQEYDYVKLGEPEAKDCLDFIDVWCALNDCDNIKSLNHERLAFRRMLENFSAFGLTGGAIRVEGKVSAVAIAERLNPETLVMHVLKAKSEIIGLYQAINQEFLAQEAGGFKYLNMEQDLGIEGLRRSKLSYHPSGMVNKYTLSYENH